MTHSIFSRTIGKSIVFNTLFWLKLEEELSINDYSQIAEYFSKMTLTKMKRIIEVLLRANEITANEQQVIQILEELDMKSIIDKIATSNPFLSKPKVAIDKKK